MLTRCLLQFLFVNCQSISSHCHNSFLECALQRRSQKFIKTPHFESFGFPKAIDVDTTEKLVTSACCDRQHAHAYLQLFS